MAFACCSPDIDAREQARLSKSIDLELEQWRRDARRELFKILLVGMVVPYTLSTAWEFKSFVYLHVLLCIFRSCALYASVLLS